MSHDEVLALGYLVSCIGILVGVILGGSFWRFFR